MKNTLNNGGIKYFGIGCENFVVNNNEIKLSNDYFHDEFFSFYFLFIPCTEVF